MITEVVAESPFDRAGRQFQCPLAHTGFQGLEIDAGGRTGSYEAGDLGFDSGDELLGAGFFCLLWVGVRRSVLESGLGELLADRDQFGQQAAQALAFGDFGTQHLGLAGGDGAAGTLAGRLEHEAEVGAVTGIALLLALAGGAAAQGEELAHRAGAEVADGADPSQDAGASLL